MKLRFALAAVATMMVLASATLPADTTVRFKNTVVTGPQLPPGLLAQMASAGMPSFPAETIIRIKGGRGYVSGEPIAYLFDFGKQQVVLLDAAHRQYTILDMKDLAAQMAAAQAGGKTGLPPAMMQQALAAMKINLETHATGKTDTVLGVGVEETEVVLAMDMDPSAIAGAPAAAAAMGPMQLVRMEMRLWRVSTAELMRHPELREWSDNFTAMNAADNPMDLFKSFFGQMPGGDAKFEDTIAALRNNTSPALRTQVSLYMPILGQLGQLAQAAGASTSDLGDMASDAPLLNMTSEAVEISSAPVDAAAVALPDGYNPVALDAFVKTAMPLPAAITPPAGAGGRGAAVRAPLHIEPSANAGRPIAPSSLDWLAATDGQDTAALRRNPGYAALVAAAVPGASYHFHADMPLATAFEQIMAGPPQPVRSRGQRFVLASAGQGFPAAMLWVDRQQGQAVGGILFNPGNGEPTPTMTLFSNQIADHATALSQLPAEFLADYQAWSGTAAPALITRYFINSAGVKTVLAHDEDFCAIPGWQARHRTDCAEMNLEDARLDLAAVEYLQGAQKGAAIRAQWAQDLRQSCGGTPDPACELKATRARVQALQQP